MRNKQSAETVRDNVTWPVTIGRCQICLNPSERLPDLTRPFQLARHQERREQIPSILEYEYRDRVWIVQSGTPSELLLPRSRSRHAVDEDERRWVPGASPLNPT